MKPYRLIFSSKMYPVYWEDVQNLPVIDSKTIFKGTEAIIVLGNNKLYQQDCCLYNYASLIHMLKKRGENYIPVRFCFPVSYSFQSVLNLIKIYRQKNKIYGSGIYRLPSLALRARNMERCIRTHENAYVLKRHPLDKRQREIKYRQLSESLKRGYNPKQPISIMLCRHWGYKDSLDDGHHRLSVCIQNEIETVYVRFCYASSVKILIPFSRRKRWLRF